MDLSKAFDCLPHDLIIEKLKAYGLTEQSCQLMHSYLSGRKQRVKLGNCISKWQNIIKGVPQGSILGPLIFNIFINDIFYFLEKSTLYNYADNTVSYCHKIYQIVLSVLQIESTTMIEWFNDNHMQANPGKFQAIAVGQKSASVIKDFKIDGTEIKCEEQVKLLGIEIDFC